MIFGENRARAGGIYIQTGMIAHTEKNEGRSCKNYKYRAHRSLETQDRLPCQAMWGSTSISQEVDRTKGKCELDHVVWFPWAS